MNKSNSKVIIGKIKKFLKARTKKVDKRRKKFILQMMIGIIQSGSTILAEIGRAVNKERKKTIKAVENSISRHLNSDAWDERSLQDEQLRINANKVRKDTLIVIDPSEVVKPYGKKLEYIDYVRDGSDPDKKLKPGYWTFESYAIREKELILLKSFPFSVRDQDTPSFPGTIEKAIWEIIKATKGRGIHLCDRGFDDVRYFELYEREKTRFIIRLVGNRRVKVVGDAKEQIIEGLAEDFIYPHKIKIMNREQGKIKSWMIEYTFCDVKIPKCEGEYVLIIIKNNKRRTDKDRYIFLLTNCKIKSWIDAERAIRRWIQRHTIEDCIRFAKQSVGLEKFLTRRLSATRKLFAIAYLVIDFYFQFADISVGMLNWFIRLGQCFKTRADFVYYKIRAGIQSFLRTMSTSTLVKLLEDTS